MKGIFIFVLDRGFVVVGDAEPHPERAFYWRMERSVTIRRWGTTQGLAELQGGPLPNTVLDPPCTRATPERSVIDVIYPTEEGAEKWRAILYASTPSKATSRR